MTALASLLSKETSTMRTIRQYVRWLQLVEYCNCDEDLEHADITRGVEILYGFCPRPIKLDIIHFIIFERADCIVTAKTSMGKSLPFQVVPFLVEEGIAIIIVPLTKIGQEQVEKITSSEFQTPAGIDTSICDRETSSESFALI